MLLPREEHVRGKIEGKRERSEGKKTRSTVSWKPTQQVAQGATSLGIQNFPEDCKGESHLGVVHGR